MVNMLEIGHQAVEPTITRNVQPNSLFVERVPIGVETLQ